MACEDRTVNVDTLWRVERIYRKQLQEEPGDTVARVSLAWCLFMQALHRAGQESTVSPLLEVTCSHDHPEVEVETEVHERDSAHLLQECLRQTVAVLQLSPNPRDHSDVERLQTLVKLSGGESLLADTEDQARRVITRLAHELLEGDTAHPRRFRRVPQRRSSDTA